MKWINHKILGASASVIAGLPPLAVIIVTASSVLPDFMELRIFKHRGWSHAWWLHVILIAMLAMILPSTTPYVFYVAFGIALHLICDSLTMTGIPATPFSDKRIAFKLFKTGEIIEYVIAMFFGAGAIAWLALFIK